MVMKYVYTSIFYIFFNIRHALHPTRTLNARKKNFSKKFRLGLFVDMVSNVPQHPSSSHAKDFFFLPVTHLFE